MTAPAVEPPRDGASPGSPPTDRDVGAQALALLDALDDVALVLDAGLHLVHANPAARRLMGLTEAAVLPRRHGIVGAVLDQVPRHLVVPAAPTTHPASWRGDVAFRPEDGRLRSLRAQVHVARADDGRMQGVSVLCQDLTGVRQLQAELTHRATHDELTGLPTRLLFLRNVAHALERGETRIAVLFLDLDNLKVINDTVGHEYGDGLLVDIARRLVAATRPHDTVARIGGDEFVILCEGVAEEAAAVELAERVRRAVTGSLVVSGVEVHTGASVGVALATRLAVPPDPEAAAVELVRHADTAMYHAKLRGRSRVAVFSEDMQAAAQAQADLATRLGAVQVTDQMQLVHQPLVSSHDGRILGTEAFVRWQHPLRGVLRPRSFLDLAEANGSIVGLGSWVLHEACRQLRTWSDADIVDDDFVVSVNVSMRELSDVLFPERVRAAVTGAGIPGHRLWLEVSEHTISRGGDRITGVLAAVKRTGATIVLDDYGVGGSSIAQLHRLPIDVLKVDGSFVHALGADDGAVARSIIQLAHSLDMATVAEWVTTAEQAEALRSFGCDLLQGEGVARTMPSPQMEAHLTRRRADVPRAAASGPAHWVHAAE